MRLSVQSSSLNSFNGGLNKLQKEFIENAKITQISRKLLEEHNMLSSFDNNKLLAVLVDKTTNIANILDIKTPMRISLYDFGFLNRNVVARTFVDSASGILQNGSVEVNKKFFKCSLNQFDEFCNMQEKKLGTSHILGMIIHEFLHVNHQAKLSIADISELKKLKIQNFKKEIKEKIAHYATKNPLELYATYWAKEICNSLDENWLPKYNPFKKPQVPLSPELRKFINAIGAIDVELVRKMTHRDKKFNWFLMRNKG